MIEPGLDGRALATVPRPHPAFSPAGLLRKEHFGALMYLRTDASTTAVPITLARLLVGAQRTSVLDLYAQTNGVPGLDDAGFSRRVALWQKQRVLDDAFRLALPVIDQRAPGLALSAPLVTHFELTAACNLRCAHCYVPVQTGPHADALTLPILDHSFSRLVEHGAPLVVLAGGEPLLRRDFFNICDSLCRHGLDAWLCSNATEIDAPTARRLARSSLRGYSISLDGGRAEIHDALRGRGQFERACRGVQALIEAGARDVKLRVTVSSINVDHLLDFAMLARELGVQRVVFKPFSQLGQASRAKQLNIPRSRYLQAVAELMDHWPNDVCPAEVGNGVPTRAPAWTGISTRFGCIAGTTSMTIASDGSLVGCGCMRDGDDWNLRDHDIIEGWRHAPGVASWRELQAGPRCQRCEQLSVCGGACRARALAKGDMGDVDPWVDCPGLSSVDVTGKSALTAR